MTATLDLLERRGWIRRVPNPADRRSVLIEITPEGRATTDQCSPASAPSSRHPVRPHPRRTGTPTGPARQDPDPDRRSRRRTTRAPPRPAQPARPAHPPARRRARSPANLRHRYSRTPKPRLRNAPKSPADAARPRGHPRTQMRVTGPCRPPPANRAHITVICTDAEPTPERSDPQIVGDLLGFGRNGQRTRSPRMMPVQRRWLRRGPLGPPCHSPDLHRPAPGDTLPAHAGVSNREPNAPLGSRTRARRTSTSARQR